jgi:hypothetical protein
MTLRRSENECPQADWLSPRPSSAAGNATEAFTDYVVGHGELWSAQLLAATVRAVDTADSLVFFIFRGDFTRDCATGRLCCSLTPMMAAAHSLMSRDSASLAQLSCCDTSKDRFRSVNTGQETMTACSQVLGSLPFEMFLLALDKASPDEQPQVCFSVGTCSDSSLTSLVDTQRSRLPQPQSRCIFPFRTCFMKSAAAQMDPAT